MNKFRPFRLGAVAVLAMCSVLSIEANAGDWYVEGALGFQVPDTIDISPSGITTLPNALSPGNLAKLNAGTWQYRPTKGMSFTGAVGKYIRPNFRVEGELSFTHVWDGIGKGIDGAQFSNYNPATWNHAFADADGEINKTRLMFSAIYDLKRISEVFTPFIGVGLGYTWVDLDSVSVKNTWPDSHYVVDGRDGYFTYAFHLGADLKLRKNLSLTARYTLSNRESMSFSGYEVNDAGVRRPGVSFKGETDSGADHAFRIGLKYKFSRGEETYKN